jgi:hypothetical protein
MLSVKLLVGILCFIYCTECANIGILSSAYDVSVDNDVISKLSPFFSNVTVVDCYSSTPTLAFLMQNFNAILLFTNYAPKNATLLAEVIKGYIDNSYGVVLNQFMMYSTFNAQLPTEYLAILPQSGDLTGRQSLSPLMQHEILNGVNSVDGGSSSYRGGKWNSNAIKIAQWTDGTPFVGATTVNGVRRVDISLYPPSSDVRSDFWNSSTDGAKLMANALNWVLNNVDQCGKYSDCLDCATNGCQWCLDSNTCSKPTKTCPDRITNPSFCPFSCSQFSTCSTCVNSQNGGECSWCLDSSSCVPENTDCADVINNQKFCPNTPILIQ